MTPAIDVQGHFMPEVQRRALADRAASDPELAALTGILLNADPSAMVRRLDDERIGMMDRAGIGVQVVSLPPPGVAFGERAYSTDLATAANDALVTAAAAHPGRFVVLASLPLPHVEESLAELERVSAIALVRGVLIDAHTTGWTLDEPQFEPLYQRLAELGLPLFLHPPLEPLPSAFGDWGLAASLATMFASTLTALRLVLSGTLDRVGGLEVIVPHLGGTLPYLQQRVSDLNGRGMAEHDLEHYLRTRFYYDSCSYHRPALRCALDSVGAERVMLGSDYPFRGPLDVCVQDIEGAGLLQAQRTAILHGTAARWFTP